MEEKQMAGKKTDQQEHIVRGASYADNVAETKSGNIYIPRHKDEVAEETRAYPKSQINM